MDTLGPSDDDNIMWETDYQKRLRTHQDPDSLNANEPDPEYTRSAKDRGSIRVTRVQGHTANISDDDFGDPISTRSYASPYGNTEFTQDHVEQFTTNDNTSTGLTKNKKIIIAGSIILLSAGTAALAAYLLLKHKANTFTPSPGPDPAPPGPSPTPCPGMTPHPPPC
ncbi:hypothetical protein BJAS_P3418 [Bathymodiolus japonicus methanotrophic gill symbiont]|uniref:hypothetical protein n=1 Tax=Bathymodiolus japonicus methanotrophic gill symbiont TaxID=113269 RepID=UPI001B623BCB|nr:hypothetical protein [Bathymodiolus japonicus methanotrophic gill symbiont]GFO72882.1 hypothetical protein BJAS_P3418 [Bathymodiolus japonicus methanotrophic gill symbiont]